MCFCTYYCCCVAITVVRERHVERCGPAVGSTGASDKAYIYANLLKQLDTEDPETHVYVRVYVGCTSCEYGNMGVCCVCVRVCNCEPVLTIVFLRV